MERCGGAFLEFGDEVAAERERTGVFCVDEEAPTADAFAN